MTSMASVDRAVVRMFISHPDTVRWETRIANGRGLELKVFGPGNVRRAQAFPDAMSLVQYQVQYERQLLSNGYTVLHLSERRSGYDRRQQRRPSEDRRR
jgi:hypothetical protein